MKIINASIKTKLIAMCIIVVFIPVLVVGLASYEEAKKEVYSQVEQRLKEQANLATHNLEASMKITKEKVITDMNVARDIYGDSGTTTSLDYGSLIEFKAVNQVTKAESMMKIPTMKVGGQAIAFNYRIVDKIKQSVGDVATIFQIIPEGAIRISTNVLDTKGNRAVGTYIDTTSPVYQAVMKGEPYYGRAFVVTDWYQAAYSPIKDNNGKVIGILFVGVKDASREVLDQLASIKIGSTGYYYILDEQGNYILSAGRKRDGENIWNSKDADGKLFIQEIIKKGTTLRDSEQAVSYYPWQNQGEAVSRMKVAGYGYFPEWKWIIAASAYQDEFLGDLGRIRIITIIFSIIALFFGMGVAYFAAALIANPIKKLEESFSKVADGDLTIKLDPKLLAKGDEIGSLSRSFKVMVDNLQGLIASILNNANKSSKSAEELSSASQQVNSSIEQVSSAIQQIASSAEQLNKGVVVATEKSKKTEENATEGARTTSIVKEKIGGMGATTRVSADKVRSLGDKSKEIGNIIGTINDISEQTNLLALNAAIEAARAGEAGRGFAVVADEVRKLAEESHNAAGNINELIKGIQEEIKSAVSSIDENIKQVEFGTGAVNEAMGSFDQIPVLVRDVNSAMMEISAVSEQNSSGAQQVSSSIQQVSSAMQQVAGSAQQLAAGSNELKQMIQKFKIDEATVELAIIDIAINDHKLWVSKLKDCLDGKITLSESELKNHHQCRLGKWYDTTGKELFGNNMAFQKLEAPHEKIHAIGNEAARLCAQGNNEGAKMGVEEAESISKEVIALLEELKQTAG